MAQALAVVPAAELGAVLLAVEFAQGCTRRAWVSVGHALSVLARLTAVSVPESAATALQVSTPPPANTDRYDSLRGVGTRASAEVDDA